MMVNTFALLYLTDSVMSFLFLCVLQAENSEEMEAKTETGLVKGHAYGITEVRRVALEGTGLFGTFNQEKINMIRCRNPWGKHEWNGRFSDGFVICYHSSNLLL